MKKHKLIVMMLAVAALWGCEKEDHITVSPDQLYGRWQQESSEYYWTFGGDGTGNLVNLGAFRPGDENNGDFTWTINNGDELEMEFRGSGELGGIDIVKTVTITGITDATVRWEDVYGRETSLKKI
ncbi:MAG: hypothetical protein IJ745_06915 [Bacteroidales bacterium]|nr:hypothetical protein [Bacteroidales bacterium]